MITLAGEDLSSGSVGAVNHLRLQLKLQQKPRTSAASASAASASEAPASEAPASAAPAPPTWEARDGSCDETQPIDIMAVEPPQKPEPSPAKQPEKPADVQRAEYQGRNAGESTKVMAPAEEEPERDFSSSDNEASLLKYCGMLGILDYRVD